MLAKTDLGSYSVHSGILDSLAEAAIFAAFFRFVDAPFWGQELCLSKKVKASIYHKFCSEYYSALKKKLCKILRAFGVQVYLKGQCDLGT